MRHLLLAAALFALAACNSENSDKLPDDLTNSEGSAQPEVVINAEAEAENDNVANEAEPADPLAPVENEADQPVPPPPVALPKPSFDCDGPVNRVESMVCGDPQLALLDRRLAREYGKALEESSPEQRQRLTNLGRRYLADRNRCGTRDCVLQSYRWYLRDIETLMGWQTP